MAKKRPTLDAFISSQAVQAPPEQEAENKFSKSPESKPKAKGSSKSAGTVSKTEHTADLPETQTAKSKKQEVMRHMLYLPLPVYDQLQELVFEEQRGQTKRRKVHDYLLDGIDLLFKKKGLKSISDLTGDE